MHETWYNNSSKSSIGSIKEIPPIHKYLMSVGTYTRTNGKKSILGVGQGQERSPTTVVFFAVNYGVYVSRRSQWASCYSSLCWGQITRNQQAAARSLWQSTGSCCNLAIVAKIKWEAMETIVAYIGSAGPETSTQHFNLLVSPVRLNSWRWEGGSNK